LNTSTLPAGGALRCGQWRLVYMAFQSCPKSAMEEFLLLREERTMNLNIKNAEAHKMAIQLAKQTGNSITAAVTEAIRRELRRTRDNSERIKRIDELTARTAAVFAAHPESSIDHGDLLYDENGLPK
jgi:antitoxin VapB